MLHGEVAGYWAAIIFEFRFGASIAVKHHAILIINILRYEPARVKP